MSGISLRCFAGAAPFQAADNQEHCCLVIIFHETLDVAFTLPSCDSLQISQIATERVMRDEL